jgi:hypothetical protein
MSVADYAQSISLILVSAALIVSALQFRQLVKQNATLATTARKSAYDALAATQAQSRIAFFANKPKLLSWYLKTRGLSSTDPDNDQRKLYVMYKLDQHEYNFVNYKEGLLSEEVWASWRKVLERDMAIPEFREVWTVAPGRRYVDSFEGLVNEIICTLPTRSGAIPNTPDGEDLE